MKNLKFYTFIACTLLFGDVFAQEITPKSIQLVKTDQLQAPQSACDYFPFLQMDLSDSSNTFLLAFCEYNISWADPDNEQETLKYSFLDLFLEDANGNRFKPVGEFTSDQRLQFTRNLKYAQVQANERSGSKTLRFGALFLVNRSQDQFVISFAGKKSDATASTRPQHQPADFAKFEIIKSELVDSTKLKESRLKRNIPEVAVSLSNPCGKLLFTKIKIRPQLPNVMGGECRYIFRPSDFMLVVDDQILRPLGFLSRNNFGLDTIYNLSRKSEEELKTMDQELTLIFAVSPLFKSGKLFFMNMTQGKTIKL
jgi:hypothetical protein